MDDIMQRQIDMFTNDQRRMGHSPELSAANIKAYVERLRELRRNHKVAHSRPFTGPNRDPTLGQYPWLPLCDI